MVKWKLATGDEWKISTEPEMWGVHSVYELHHLWLHLIFIVILLLLMSFLMSIIANPSPCYLANVYTTLIQINIIDSI